MSDAVFDNFQPSLILEVLLRHRVEFLVVGGLGATSHGSARNTYDIDVVPERSADNLSRLAAALRELDARIRLVDAPDADTFQVPLDAVLLKRMQISNWHTRFGNLDVLADIPSLTGLKRGFDDLVEKSAERDVAGRVVIVASLDHIIESKQYANRPKDREALPELEALRDRLAEE